MTLADTGMTGEALRTQHLGTDTPVTDIRFAAKAFYAGCIAADDSDVVQHGCLLNELTVKRKFGMSVSNSKGFVSHGTAVDEENMAQGIVLGVKLIDDCLIIHCSWRKVGGGRVWAVGCPRFPGRI